MTEYAYIRVSHRTQNESRQRIEVQKKYPNILPDNIIVEKASGKNFIDRKNYIELRNKLTKSDLLIIPSIDRLGRNMKEVSSEWEYLTNHGIDIDVLDMELLNTRNNHAGLTGELINRLIVTILSYVGEKERLSIKERQRQGIDNALEHGTKKGKKAYGRPKMEKLPTDFIKYYTAYKKENKYTPTEIQKLCGLTKTTYYRYVRRYEKELK